MVLAKRPSIADFLVAEGALKSAVQLLLKGGPGAGDPSPASVPYRFLCRAMMPRGPVSMTGEADAVTHLCLQSPHEGPCARSGDQQTADVAVAAVWGLVKGNQRLLRPEAEALGAPGTALAGPLLDVVLRGKVRFRPWS